MDLDPRVCSRARLSRDARFDGRLFIGVRSTLIYCRSICPVRKVKETNVRYFPSAAVAAEAGYRPCTELADHSVNTFPRLPVREGENVFVWFAGFRDHAAYNGYLTAVSNSMHSRAKVWEELAHRLKKKPEVLKLSPTARSRLRG